ncbi:pyruvate kinase [Azospirillum doebereinerae]|uniref:Pyruvate kinase n=1 Tax=Azospirillum doebereinerae TaxID=92933 RepID=A0A433J374_9PROT|nr:pyruvate kinase [Azospirillum doebereinerae]MCG5241576.1 pyruvate kinase [Azospirillum doebereinerae]RUQ66179.1 pyruvate kinase [Azospirillum doebereinerae]
MTTGTPIRRFRQTKIVATLGPSSSSPAMIRSLFETGVDVFRLNFSHGSHEDHGERVRAIRELERETGRPIAIMADLQGPKLRLGKFANGPIELTAGQSFRLDLSTEPGDATRVGMPHPEIFAALEPNTDLLLDDGKVRLRVIACDATHADTVVVSGTRLSDRKGVNVPDVVLPLSPLTPKDCADLVFALDQGVDWVALSFVQRPEDVAEARKLIDGRAALLSKLEKPQAIQHLERIVELSDGVMVARGDLGVEMPPEDVPSIQKRIVRQARLAGKPVIVATQMLESMISAPAPTRAEASDVATAIFDGADAVMLSAETASGAYPIEAVSIMDRIARRVEHDTLYRTMMDAQHSDPQETASDAITAAARQVAHTIHAAAIVTYTTSGSTTLRAARERPEVPILCLTASVAASRRLVLAYGVHSVLTEDVQNFSDMVHKAARIAYAHGLADDGQRLVVTAGVPFGMPGSTNILRIVWVERPGLTAGPRDDSEQEPQGYARAAMAGGDD